MILSVGDFSDVHGVKKEGTALFICGSYHLNLPVLASLFPMFLLMNQREGSSAFGQNCFR